jgi:chromatin remodeling complex protein RSC6
MSVLIKPVKISEQLSNFLGLDYGIEISRAEVVRKLSEYITVYSLYGDGVGKIDLSKPGGDKLATLLNISRNLKIDYFQMHAHLVYHFPMTKKKLKELEEASVNKVELKVSELAIDEAVDEIAIEEAAHIDNPIRRTKKAHKKNFSSRSFLNI